MTRPGTLRPTTPMRAVRLQARMARALRELAALRSLASWASGERRVGREALLRAAQAIRQLRWTPETETRAQGPIPVISGTSRSLEVSKIAQDALRGNAEARGRLLNAYHAAEEQLSEMNLPRRWDHVGEAYFMRQLILGWQAERRAMREGRVRRPFYAPLIASPARLAELASRLHLEEHGPLEREAAQRWKQRRDREMLRVAESLVLHKTLPDEVRRRLEKGASIRREYRRCGKKTCATCIGGRGHGPYLYIAWRTGSRVERHYLGTIEKLLE